MKKEDSKFILIASILIISLILITIGLLNGVKWFYPELEQRAQFGDSANFVSVIFSGLALFAIIISLYFQNESNKMQREDLKLAREEMKLTREELKKTSEAQIKQTEIMRMQAIDYFEEKLKSEKNNGLLSYRHHDMDNFYDKKDRIFSNIEKLKNE